jgi:serine/threonine protein kinase
MRSRNTGNLPYLFQNEYKTIQKLHTGPNRSLYGATSIKNNSEYMIKQIVIENKEEYLEMENLLPMVAKLELIECSKLVKYYQFHNRDITPGIHELCLVSDRCVSSLEEHLLILGKKRIFTFENVTDLILDSMDAIKALHNAQILYLGLHPKNILYTREKKYKISDPVFNTVYLSNVMAKLAQRKLHRPDNFPEMSGKYEFTKLTVHDGGNLHTTTSTTKPDFSSQGLDAKLKHSPYIAPEIFFDEKFTASLFSEEFSKADVFS